MVCVNSKTREVKYKGPLEIQSVSFLGADREDLEISFANSEELNVGDRIIAVNDDEELLNEWRGELRRDATFYIKEFDGTLKVACRYFDAGKNAHKAANSFCVLCTNINAHEIREVLVREIVMLKRKVFIAKRKWHERVDIQHIKLTRIQIRTTMNVKETKRVEIPDKDLVNIKPRERKQFDAMTFDHLEPEEQAAIGEVTRTWKRNAHRKTDSEHRYRILCQEVPSIKDPSGESVESWWRRRRLTGSRVMQRLERLERKYSEETP